MNAGVFCFKGRCVAFLLEAVFLPESDGASKAIVMEGDSETGEPVPTFVRTAADGKTQERHPLRGESVLAAVLRDGFWIFESA